MLKYNDCRYQLHQSIFKLDTKICANCQHRLSKIRVFVCNRLYLSPSMRTAHFRKRKQNERLLNRQILYFCSSSDSFTILPIVHLEKQYVAVGTVYYDEMDYVAKCPNAIMAVAYQDNTTVYRSICLFIILHPCSCLFRVLSSCLQIRIGTQESLLNALQVVTLAVNSITSGTTVSGSKPFAAFSGNMCGAMHTRDSGDYAMVLFDFSSKTVSIQ